MIYKYALFSYHKLYNKVFNAIIYIIMGMGVYKSYNKILP